MKQSIIAAAAAPVLFFALSSAAVAAPSLDNTISGQGNVIAGFDGDNITSVEGLGNSPRRVSSPTIVYDTLTGNAPTTAIGNDPTGSRYGDVVGLADTGILDEVSIDIWANSTNTGNIDSGVVNLSFYSLADFTAGDYATGFLGGFNGGFDLFDETNPLDTGLQPGFFTTLTYSGLQDLEIDITETEVVFVMQYNELVVSDGTEAGAGTILRDALNVGGSFVGGSGQDLVYQDFAPDGGADAGFYTIGTLEGFVTARITLVPEPATLGLLAAAGLGLIRRR
jgi:hypothetical protein